MPNFIRIAKTTDIPPGKGRTVSVGQKLVAVFNVDGRFYAVNNVCPHMGGPIASGAVNGTVVTCPSHRMCFHLTTGESADSFGHRLQTYEIKVEGDEIFIDAWWAKSRGKAVAAAPRPLAARPIEAPACLQTNSPAPSASPPASSPPSPDEDKPAPVLTVVNGHGGPSHR